MKNQQAVRLRRHWLGCIALVLAMVQTPAWSHGNCVSFSEQLQTLAPTPFGPFQGFSALEIGNEATVEQFTAILNGSPEILDNGIIVARFNDQWVFPDGNSLTARNKTVATPTGNPGEFELSVRIHFTGGSGPYSGVRGKARLQGPSQLAPDGSATTNATAIGKLCGSGESAPEEIE